MGILGSRSVYSLDACHAGFYIGLGHLWRRGVSRPSGKLRRRTSYHSRDAAFCVCTARFLRIVRNKPMWFRLAINIQNTNQWVWVKDTYPTQNTGDIDRLLQSPYYRMVQERLWLFEAENIEDLDRLLFQKNCASQRIRDPEASPVLDTTHPIHPERLDLERGGGDHDQPYTFVLPTHALEVSVLSNILGRYGRGEFPDDDPLGDYEAS